jgi:hypothetical protein
MADNVPLYRILSGYFPEGGVKKIESCGKGHINDTYLVCLAEPGGPRQYILQKINRNVFKKPYEVMDNVIKVTEHLRLRIGERGGDPERETLNLIKNQAGEYSYIDERSDYWRVYNYIDHTVTIESTKDPNLFYRAALAFGDFFRMLEDFPADSLQETIPDFHNTPARYLQLKNAVRQDPKNRVKDVQKELTFVEDRLHELSRLTQMKDSGDLPVRVTHNDTKLNNVLLDASTHEGVCVIDLDTVMPGLCANDFGDSIRFGANTSDEDETDLQKCTVDMSLYRAYTEGFLEKARPVLTKSEIETLPFSAKLITLELGMRFLADHISGDGYFKIHRPGHNLDRARNQFCLALEMEKRMKDMEVITKGIAGGSAGRK